MALTSGLFHLFLAFDCCIYKLYVVAEQALSRHSFLLVVRLNSCFQWTLECCRVGIGGVEILCCSLPMILLSSNLVLTKLQLLRNEI